MKKLYPLLILTIIILTSCSENSIYEDHPLNGNYLGQWESVVTVTSRFTIEANEEDDGLIFFFSLNDTIHLNLMSETRFDIDRYERNGFSNYLTGELQGDTLFLENETYTVSDPVNTQTIRKGTFVKQ